MKRLPLFLAVVLSTGTLLAQHGKGCDMKNMPKYDPSSMQTITGTIASIDRQDHGKHTGIVLQVTAASKTITVHVGPAAFLQEHGVTLAAGDAITITGSMTHMRGSDALVAAELQKGSTTLKLRDASGKPLWAMSYCNQ